MISAFDLVLRTFCYSHVRIVQSRKLVILPDVFRNVLLSFLYSGSCLKRLYLFQQAVFFTVSPSRRHFCLQRLYSLWRNSSVTYFVPKPIRAWNISPRSIRDFDCFTGHVCTSSDKQTVVNQFCLAIIVARESLASFSYLSLSFKISGIPHTFK
jgi:hypothetical protein